MAQMRRTANIIMTLLMSIIVAFPISAKLGISVYTGRRIISDTYAKNMMDYALYAANGKEWFVDNVLFHDYGNIYIFFAPGNVIAMTSQYFRHSSRQEITKDYIMGIKKAIDYLAEHDGILYIKDTFSTTVKYGGELKPLLEKIHACNQWVLFIYPEWRAEARFGRLDAGNSQGMVSMFYNNGSSIHAFGAPYQEGNLIRVYEDSCRKRGVKPIFPHSKPYRERPDDFSDSDIDFFLECRFGGLDFNKAQYHTELYPTQEFVHVLDYSPDESNERTFEYYKTATLTPGDSRDAFKNSALTMAVYPSELGPLGRIRSISKISRALYEANGREWFVDNLLFSPRIPSDLFFLYDGLFCCRTGYTPDDGFVAGMARAIDLLSEKKDTLCAPVLGWEAPYDTADNAVKEWAEKNRQHYLFDDTWTAEIRTFPWEVQYKDPLKQKVEPFMLEGMKIWPYLDNGTKEGRIFRAGYEKACRDRNLKIIGEGSVGKRSDYSDEDIDLFVDWIMKANDYYISQPAPAVLRPLNVRYWVAQMDERKLTIRETCRQ